MTLLATNLFLALAWAALWGSFDVVNLLAGFVFGFFALWFARHLLKGTGEDRYFRTIGQSLVLAGYFLKELVKSCLLVARDCVARDLHRICPAIVKMPIGEKSDLEIFVLANLITLTPGTLTLDVAEDKSYLLIHSIYAADPEALIAELKSGMEHRVREVFR